MCHGQRVGRRLRPVALAVAALVFAVTLPSCRGCDDAPDAREAILAVVARGIASAEQQDVEALLADTTSELLVDPGGYDRRALRQLLFIAFRKLGGFTVHMPTPVVEFDDDAGTATLEATCLLVRAGQAVPDLSGLGSEPTAWLKRLGRKFDVVWMKLSLHRDGDDWQIVHVQAKSTRRWHSM